MDRNHYGVLQALLRAYSGGTFYLLCLLGHKMCFIFHKMIFCRSSRSIVRKWQIRGGLCLKIYIHGSVDFTSLV